MEQSIIEKNKFGYVKELLVRNDPDGATAILTRMKDGEQKNDASRLVVDYRLSERQQPEAALELIKGMKAGAVKDELLFRIVDQCMGWSERDFFDIFLEAIRLASPGDERNRVACELCRQYNAFTNIERVMQLVGNVPEMVDVLESAVASALKRKSPYDALGIIRLLGRKLKPGEHEAMVDVCMENGDWQDLVNVFALSNKEMTLADTVRFVGSLIQWLRLGEALVGIKTMPDGGEKTAALLSLVEAFKTAKTDYNLFGYTNTMLHAIPMLSDPIVRRGAYESAIATSVEAGMYAVAQRFVDAAGRKLTSDEIGTMILANPSGCDRYGSKELAMAEIMADGPVRKRIAEKLLVDLLQIGDVGSAQKAARLCGRVLGEKDMLDVLKVLSSSDSRNIAAALELVDRELTREEIGELLG